MNTWYVIFCKARQEFVAKVEAATKPVKIGLIGKYVALPDAYLSVIESIKHAAHARIESSGNGVVLTEIPAELQPHDTRVARAERPDHLPRPVSAAVFDEHQLVVGGEWAQGSRQPRIELVETGLRPIHRNDDGNVWDARVAGHGSQARLWHVR